MAVLDPEVLRADHTALALGAFGEVRGQQRWPIPSRGGPASPDRHSSTAPPEPCGRRGSTTGGLCLHDRGGKILAIDLLADLERLRRLNLAILDD